MIRIGGVLALLASLALAGFLALRVREFRITGAARDVNAGAPAVFTVDDPSYGWDVPTLPPTLPAALEADLSNAGGLSLPTVRLEIRLPDELRAHAAVGAAMELRHGYLSLPWIGPWVGGKTSLTVGPGTWEDDSWWLRGTIAGLALLPLLAWAAVSIPLQLLKRPRAA